MPQQIDPKYREEADKIAERVRVGCHNNFNGGHHEKATNEAFHHGMDTVCNGLAETIASALQSIATKHDDEIKELREAIKQANQPIKHNDASCLRHDCPTVDKANLTLEIFSERNLLAFDTCRNIQLTRKEE